MGKYMKKSTVTEVSPQQAMACGVRTRAKTLALQQSLSPGDSPATDSSSLSFLQLRSRRLQKPPPSPLKSSSKQPLQPDTRKCSPRSNLGHVIGPAEPGSSALREELRRRVENCRGIEAGDCDDLWVEASFGENALESQGIGRATRESTPCSFIRDPDTAPTPTSTTKRANSRTSTQRVQNGEIPRVHEIEEIFDCVEEQQRRSFSDKYNFDIAKDMPLQGRFDWVRVV